MKLLLMTLIAAGSAGAAIAPELRTERLATLEAVRVPGIPAPSWAPADTGDTLWRRGRIAISDEAWSDAAEAFRSLVERYPRSAYAGDALYWEAFALQRIGRSSDLRRAVRALERQKEDYPKAATYASGESSTLLARVNGRLARAGDHEAALSVAELAAEVSEVTAASIQTALVTAANEIAKARPEIERQMAEVQRGLTRTEREMSQRERENAQREREMSQREREMERGRSGDLPEGCEDRGEDDERVEALNALLQMNSEQALPILKKVLERRDKCSEVLRRKAVFLVSQKRSDEAADILLTTAKTDPDRETREQAVFWLSQTNGERAVEVLEQILLRDAPDEEMQKKAVFSLSQSRSARAQVILRDLVRRRDVDEEVRGEAIFWLGQRRGEENSAMIREIFPTLETQELQEKAIFSLSQSRSEANSQFLLTQAKNRRLDPELRKSALFWAGQSGAAVKDLGEIYDSGGDDTELRNQVIFVLSQRKNDTAAIDKLLDIARREQDRELRRQAIFWLGQSRDPRVPKLLEEIINRP
jgi:HEAT repeat protein